MRIVKATLGDHIVDVTPVILGDAMATDITTGNPVQLNLQDPDSMISDPEGDLVLDSQADAELIFVHHPGLQDQSVFHLALASGGNSTQIDDTVLASSSQRRDSGFGPRWRDHLLHHSTVFRTERSVFCRTDSCRAA